MTRRSNYKPVVIGILIVLGTWVIILSYWYATGVIFSNAVIADFGICADDTVYAPLQTVSNSADELYFCGVIRGKGKWSGLLEVYNEDEFIAREGLSLEPGTFFIPASPLLSVSSEITIEPGLYRAIIVIDNHVAEEIEFHTVD